jgi:DNA-binding MarR family transcriptional regulator
MKTTQAPSRESLRLFGRLMDGFSLLTDRSNFLKQRCSGLGRMECQTLQILDAFRLQKRALHEKIRSYSLTEREVEMHIPRSLRASYAQREIPAATLKELPRDLSMKQLAEQIGVACSRMTRIGDTLSDDMNPTTKQQRGKGLVHREPSPDDRRVILIRITNIGSDRVAQLGRNNERIVRALLDKIPAKDVKSVERGLSCYLKALHDILPEIIDPNKVPVTDEDCGV